MHDQGDLCERTANKLLQSRTSTPCDKQPVPEHWQSMLQNFVRQQLSCPGEIKS